MCLESLDVKDRVNLMTQPTHPGNVNFLIFLLINPDIPSEILTFTFKVFMAHFNLDEFMEILSKSTHQGKPLVNVVAEFSSLKVVEIFFKFKHCSKMILSIENFHKLMSPDILKLRRLQEDSSVALHVINGIENVFSSAEISELILECKPFKLDNQTKMFLENLFSKHLTDENFKTLFKFDHRWKYLENCLASLNTSEQIVRQKSLKRFFEIIHGKSCDDHLIIETFRWAFEGFIDTEQMKFFAEKCLMGTLCNISQPKYLKEIVDFVKFCIGKEGFLKVLENADTFFDWYFEGKLLLHNSKNIFKRLAEMFSICWNDSEIEAFMLNKIFFKDENFLMALLKNRSIRNHELRFVFSSLETCFTKFIDLIQKQIGTKNIFLIDWTIENCSEDNTKVFLEWFLENIKAEDQKKFMSEKIDLKLLMR